MINKFLQIIFLLANFFKANVNITVTSKFKTPGTHAAISPTAIITAIIILKPVKYPPKKVKSPTPREKRVTTITNL